MNFVKNNTEYIIETDVIQSFPLQRMNAMTYFKLVRPWIMGAYTISESTLYCDDVEYDYYVVLCKDPLAWVEVNKDMGEYILKKNS